VQASTDLVGLKWARKPAVFNTRARPSEFRRHTEGEVSSFEGPAMKDEVKRYHSCALRNRILISEGSAGTSVSRWVASRLYREPFQVLA
jgi:hypothetical protein